VHQLLPDPLEDADPAALYAADPRPVPPGRPWVLINMIASADGATTVGGLSGALGGPGDKRVFAAVRAVADVVLVAAGTVRAERYGPPRSSAAVAAARAARSQSPAPRLAVVTASLALEPDSRLFAEADPGNRPLILTTATAPPDRRSVLSEVADIVVAGDTGVEPGAALAALWRLGARVVVCEGGPSLNGQLVAAGLVDELCLSVAPVLVGGDSARIAHGDVRGALLPLRLDRVLEDDHALFIRYVSVPR
jgi:riboflavin biosynthesis pyrimidine reductase